MPNWCDNTLKISGDPVLIKNLVDMVGKSLPDYPETVFSFENITPSTPDAKAFLGKAFKSEGPEDSYHNNINSWGTKWDVAGESRMSHYSEGYSFVEYGFESAWSPVPLIVEALSNIFPELEMTYSYYETGMDFWGIETYLGGEMTSEEGGGLCHTAWRTLGLDCWNCQQYEEDPEEYAEYLYTDCPDYVEEKKEVEVSA